MAGPCLKQEPVLALPIFPGRRQPSIVSRNELNYRVRNGNGWTLALISTNFVVAKSACLCFRLRRKLRPLPCSSSSSRTRFTGLRSEGDTTLCYPVLPENKLYYIVFRPSCQELSFSRKTGDPYRIRTDVNGVRGRCLNHLTNGPCLASWGPHWMVLPSSGMVHLQGLEPWTP